MTLKNSLPETKLGKISLLLVFLTFALWVFAANASNCLSRDFVTKPNPAICWRKVNDYENVITYSDIATTCLLALAIACSSSTLSRLIIRRSRSSYKENRKTALFLGSLCILMLIFVITVWSIWQRTTFNNNNYTLNTAATAVITLGTPLFLAFLSATVTYGAYSIKRRT